MKIKLIKHKITDLKAINPKSPLILGIDPSLTHTGIITIDPADNKVVHQLTIIPKVKGVQRLAEYSEFFEQFLMQHTIDRAVIEGYGYSPRQNNLMGLGELGGIIRLELYKSDVPFHVVAPMSLKKFGTGSGKGDKNKIMLSVYRKYGIELKDDNQTDAFILAQIGIRILQQKDGTLPNNAPKYELEVIKTVLKHETT